MRKILGPAVVAFAAVAASAQPVGLVDSYTANASEKTPDGRILESLSRRDSTAGECLSHMAVLAVHPAMTSQNTHYEGACRQDFPLAGKPAVSFTFVCDGRRNADAAERLFELGKRLHHAGQPINVDITDVRSICTTVPAEVVMPATRLDNPTGLPILQ